MADASVTVVVRRGVGGVPLVRAAELLLLAETAAQHQVFPVGGLCGAGGHSGASDRLPGRGRARRGCRIGPGLTEDHDLRILGRLAAAQQHQPAEDLDHEQVEQAEGHRPRFCRNRFIRPSRRSQYLWRVLNRYTG